MNTHDEIRDKAKQLVLQGNGNKAINGQALAEYEIGQVKSRFIWMDGTETIVPAAQVQEFFRDYWPEKKYVQSDYLYKMEKSVQKKIIKQLERLCEKQFRKGFQQGFYACKNNELTQEQVDKFRWDGMKEDYSKVIQPHNGRKEVAKNRLLAEIAMPDMNELRHFLTDI